MSLPSAQYSKHTAVYFRTNSSCFFYCALLRGGVIMDGAGTLLFYQSSKYRPVQHKCINTALWTRSRASCPLSGCFLFWSVCPGSAAVYSLHMYIDIYFLKFFLRRDSVCSLSSCVLSALFLALFIKRRRCQLVQTSQRFTAGSSRHFS